MANIRRLNYRFISLKRLDSFRDICQKNNITVWVSKPDNNLNKIFKKWYRHINVSDDEQEKLIEFKHCIL